MLIKIIKAVAAIVAFIIVMITLNGCTTQQKSSSQFRNYQAASQTPQPVTATYSPRTTTSHAPQTPPAATVNQYPQGQGAQQPQAVMVNGQPQMYTPNGQPIIIQMNNERSWLDRGIDFMTNLAGSALSGLIQGKVISRMY